MPENQDEYSLEQADGLFALERGIDAGNSGDLLPIPDHHRLDDSITPSVRSWDNLPSEL